MTQRLIQYYLTLRGGKNTMSEDNTSEQISDRVRYEDENIKKIAEELVKDKENKNPAQLGIPAFRGQSI